MADFHQLNSIVNTFQMKECQAPLCLWTQKEVKDETYKLSYIN